jgi:predicted Zn finger-like uncharacterized protein
MQIVCPNCAARYLVDPAAIGRRGRTVQCFRCGHKWMAHVPAYEDESPAEPVMTDTRPVPDFVIRPQNHDEPISLPTIPPERGMPTWLKVTLGLLILVGLIGGAGYMLRDSLTGPPATPMVAPASTKPPPVAALKLADVRVELVSATERSITGTIINTTTAEVTPRRLHILFKGKDGQTIGEKTFELEPEPIAPLGRRPFRQRLDDTPPDTADVTVTIEPLS